MAKYTMRRDDSGTEYTLDTDEHYLRQRLIGDGPVKPGSQFRFRSKLDDSTWTETLVSVEKKKPNLDYAGCSRHSTWPMKSDAMGINPDQYEEQMAADEQLGVKIGYDRKTGEAIFSSAGQYKRYCEAHGFFDRNSGYGGPKRRDQRERDNLGLPQLVSRNQGLSSEILSENR